MPTFVADEVVAAAKLNRLNGPDDQAVEATDQSVTSSTFAAGSPVCGLTFVATDTWVWVHLYGFIEVSPSGGSQRRIELAWELREGSTIGSGTVLLAADGITRGIAIASATASSGTQLAAGHTYRHTGLTVGNSYNVRTMHRVNDATAVTANVLQRQLGVS